MPDASKELDRAFVQRTKELREKRGYTQAQVALALGIELERYKKYEQRSPMPHAFVPRFLLCVGAGYEDIYGVAINARAHPQQRRAS